MSAGSERPSIFTSFNTTALGHSLYHQSLLLWLAVFFAVSRGGCFLSLRCHLMFNRVLFGRFYILFFFFSKIAKSTSQELPEWPLAALPTVPGDVQQAVQTALMDHLFSPLPVRLFCLGVN